MVNSDQLAEESTLYPKFNRRDSGPTGFMAINKRMKTLGIRMEEHERNTKELIVFLENHPAVKKVFYPGLETHPQHDMAKEQMRGFGAMVSFDVGTGKKAEELLKRYQVLYTCRKSWSG